MINSDIEMLLHSARMYLYCLDDLPILYIPKEKAMAAEVTKQSLIGIGFDPSFLDKVIQDFSDAAPVVFQLIADYRAMGFGVAWIVELVGVASGAGMQVLQDLLALFKTPSQSVRNAMQHPLCKAGPGTAAGVHPFLDWLIANASTFSPILLKLLLSLLAKKSATP